MIIGLVKRIHIRTDVLNKKGDAIDPFKLKPVLRFGSGGYGIFGDGFLLPRHTWNAKKDEVEQFYARAGREEV